MPWSGGSFTRGNGTYTGANVWASDATAGIKIVDSRHDTHDQDLAQGINACVAKDGSNTCTILNLSGTVNSTSGVIKVGSVVLASTYGSQNAFFGGAGNFTMSGAAQQNAGFGYLCLAALTDGPSNAALGQTALTSLTTGGANTAAGHHAGGNATTGSSNVFAGYDAGATITTGSNNVVVGTSADVPSASANGQLSLQNALYGTGNTGTGATASTGNLGVYVKAPTARLHLAAGTATANTAPLKLTAGTNLGTPENGAIEFDGTAVYITIGGVRKTFTVT